MGPYLTCPNIEKCHAEGENGSVRYGCTSMQGWRKAQEDTHITNLNIGEDMHSHERDV